MFIFSYVARRAHQRCTNRPHWMGGPLKMETAAERNVTALKIAGLEVLVKRQAAQLEALTTQLSVAQTPVQIMAVKAIAGAAEMKSAVGGVNWRLRGSAASANVSG